MKNVLYFSGAAVNAGDFLIEKRAKALINRFAPDVVLTSLNRVKIDYSDRIDYLNSFDAILFAGGPIYQLSIYPNAIPFVSNLNDITRPVFFLGGGCKSDVYGSVMSDKTKAFFKQGVKNGIPLGCRDILTYRFLKHQGFENIIVTGCPAWYSIPDIDNINLSNHHNGDIKKICISEPAREENIRFLMSLLKHLRMLYTNADIQLVNHRETKQNIMSLKNEMKKIGVEIIDISGTSDGFSVYDDCDLHVGFRVHAHIYNLSKRNLSILFNEDIRGYGVNHVLGLESFNLNIESYSKKKLFRNYYLMRMNTTNKADIICEMFDDYIEFEEKRNYVGYLNAFKKMKDYYCVMEQHIKAIDQAI